MKVNELRVGNFVRYNGANLPVYSISSPLPDKNKAFDNKERVVLSCDGLIYATIENVEPIPLTKEFFEKNGFIKQHDWEEVLYYRSEDMRIDVYENYLGWVVNIDDDVFTIVFSNNLKHVHELQNAYYISTGEELEIKL